MKKRKINGRGGFTVLFLILLFSYASMNLIHTGDTLWKELRGITYSGAADCLEAVNARIEEQLLWKEMLKEGGGAVCAAMGKHEIDQFQVVKDKEGYLFPGSFWSGLDVSEKELAIRVRRLQDALQEQGTRVGFVLTPTKEVRQSAGYAGIPYNDLSRRADSLLRWLRYYSVPVLDLRQELRGSGLAYDEIYYKTDSHWRTEAAFYGFRSVVEWMNQKLEAGIDENVEARSSSAYERIAYPGVMYGSLAEKTGAVYSGPPETFTLMIPREGGRFRREYGSLSGAQTRQGSFADTLLNLDPLSQSAAFNALSVYLGETQEYERIENEERQAGPSVLLLRDTNAAPVGVFLARCVPEVVMLTPREYEEGEIEQYLQGRRFDYVLVMLHPENFTMENFPYFGNQKIKR